MTKRTDAHREADKRHEEKRTRRKLTVPLSPEQHEWVGRQRQGDDGCATVIKRILTEAGMPK